MKPQLLSGARGQLKIGTKTLAYVTDVSISVTHNVRPVHTFGAPNARSVEPLSVSPVSISVGRVIPVNKAAETGPTGSVNTSAISQSIEPLISQLMTSEDISIELSDKITGATIANVKNVRFSGRSMNVSAGQLAQERLSFIGIYDAGPNVGANPDGTGGTNQNTPQSPLGF